MSVEHGRPNACNQCHVDQTLAWTGEHLQQWYNIEPIALDEDEKTISATLLWMLRGDAIQRVLAAWTLGWEPSRQPAADEWRLPFLAQLLDDPYSMTRFMAAGSLEKLGVELQPYDFLESPQNRPSAAEAMQKEFRFPKPTDANSTANGVLPFIGGDQALNRKLLEKLLLQRDDRPITLNE
jgi:hypothetical protein